MCGRYALFLAPQKLKDLFGTDNLVTFPSAAQAVPGQSHPVIVRRRMGLARWGFTLPDRKDVINARSETAAHKPLFAQSWHKARRCLVPASGFYEWAQEGGRKRPYFIYAPAHECLALAGLWHKDGGGTVRFVILTKPATPELLPIHDRMPVIFTPSRAERWFAADALQAERMMREESLNDLICAPAKSEVAAV